MTDDFELTPTEEVSIQTPEEIYEKCVAIAGDEEKLLEAAVSIWMIRHLAYELEAHLLPAKPKHTKRVITISSKRFEGGLTFATPDKKLWKEP